MKKTILSTAFILLLPSLLLAYGLEAGSAAPDFRVTSGDGQVLTLEGIKSKATGLFYETREVIKENLALKNALSKYYETQPEAVRENIVRFPVINCSRIFMLTAGIWRAQLRKHSEIEGITIYGDWNGKMFSDYKIEDGKSNVFLIDKNGVIRYYAAGKIEGQQMEEVLALFKRLVEE